ncbi:hypothetical protein HanRHA438_Chr11g0503631 [Helianthus annuus]|uniref:Uncharacterized protein n=1 Tax=Helianthus annuus TaxID=4232 RepID=A0A9K3N017_HELAN|nr:hypothetical protein HanXRQr2_Chr11g0490881 [Helianthus annuus]KAJ0501585.1 hypothetical protein HanHA300_Chr11g0402381 [Helianthus annuus]KAJ0509415.1 hypothetical protein HanIR_Chr11g0528511 [Helianthus annuus]KAJ0517491.1 hypothetical protein HanHA89_Chr11g0425881 [Helianthus annuus]KAJ0685501.1 hypothetical protein HanLR1_Chr11g0403321 [Helianthus annuus]
MKYNSLKHNIFIHFQQYPFYPNPPHPIFGRPTKPQNFISNFKSRALFQFRFLSPSKIWIWIWIGCALSSQFTTSYAGETLKRIISQILKDFRPEITVRRLQSNVQEAERYWFSHNRKMDEGQ